MEDHSRGVAKKSLHARVDDILGDLPPTKRSKSQQSRQLKARSNPNLQEISNENERICKRSEGQRKRRERELKERLLSANKSSEPTPKKQPQQRRRSNYCKQDTTANTSEPNKYSTSQSARRVKERSKISQFVYKMDGIIDGISHSRRDQMLERAKGTKTIIGDDKIPIFFGSSSTGIGNRYREYKVIREIPVKELYSSACNEEQLDIHPIIDSHYDTIFEDEMEIPDNQTIEIIKERHYLGRMDIICPSCSASHWLDEQLTKSRVRKPLFGMCCLQGKIQLPTLSPLPPAIKMLYEGSDKFSRNFRKNIRFYNAANAFSSLGVTIDDRILKGRGPTSFTIHGELSHKIGSLLPEPDKDPCYSQLYIYDPNVAFDYRKRRNLHLDPAVLKIIQETLLQSNGLCQIYKGAYEILKEANNGRKKDISIRLTYTSTTDPRRYNLPTSEDIAVIIPGDETVKTSKREIILHLKNDSLEKISECHPLYLPSHYVLLFPTGDLGWSTDMKHWDVVRGRFYTGNEKQNRLTQFEFFCYRLFERSTEYSALFRAGPLFQQFIVDAWASYEQNRLYYIRSHQDDLRCEVYSGLTDIVANGENPNDLGKKYILPSTHLGIPRHMYEIYQDSMAITRYHKHPDIFMTVSANPKWPEIQNELKLGQSALDRPELVARVFELKWKAIMDVIEKKHIFGRVVAKVYTIEFQKRGLPHMHCLLFLHKEDKIHSVEQVDKIVSAEFPDPIKHLALFETKKKLLVHGPCGTRNSKSSCMVNDLCKSKYPRANANETLIDRDGYPIYRANGS